MKIHLYFDLQEICPIGWANAQEPSDYVIVQQRHINSKKQSWDEIFEGSTIQSLPIAC